MPHAPQTKGGLGIERQATIRSAHPSIKKYVRVQGLRGGLIGRARNSNNIPPIRRVSAVWEYVLDMAILSNVCAGFVGLMLEIIGAC